MNGPKAGRCEWERRDPGNTDAQIPKHSVSGELRALKLAGPKHFSRPDTLLGQENIHLLHCSLLSTWSRKDKDPLAYGVLMPVATELYAMKAGVQHVRRGVCVCVPARASTQGWGGSQGLAAFGG